MENWRAAELTFKDGRVKRFGPDERDDADIPRSLRYESQMPGGFHVGSFILPRPANLQADDASLFSHIKVYGPGERTFYEGAVAGSPQVGVSEVQIETEGHVEQLSDDESFREIFIDQDLSRWEGPSVAFTLALLGGYTAEGGQILPDEESGEPALMLACTGAWDATGKPHPMMQYRSPVDLGSLYYAWKKSSSISEADASWHWNALAEPTDATWTAGYDSSGELRAAGPGSGTLTISSAANRYLRVALSYAAAAGVDNVVSSLFWTCLAIYGAHGLTKRGTADYVNPQGFYGSDIVEHIFRQIPDFNVDPAMIEAGANIITQLAYRDPTTRRKVIEDVTILGGSGLVPNDWGVYDNRTPFWLPPGSYGRTWRVRKDKHATMDSAGPDASRRVNGVMVTYRTGAGQTRTVGPTGSGADTETTDLEATDPSNPAVGSSRNRVRAFDAGITSVEGATNVGRLLLAELNQVRWTGQISLKGEIEDTAGNLHPPDAVRAGDIVIVGDDDYELELPIVHSAYDHDALENKVDIGRPADRAGTLIAQLAHAVEAKV